MNNNLLECGKIVNTHGLKGEVRLFPWCDSPDFLLDFDVLYQKDGSPINIESIKVHKNMLIIKFEEIDSINDAEKYLGTVLYINKEDAPLEEGQYFIEDLKGLLVFDIDTGEKYGVLVSVIETGAKDVFEIKTDNQKTLLIPNILDVVKEINLSENKMLIKPLEGLFDE